MRYSIDENIKSYITDVVDKLGKGSIQKILLEALLDLADSTYAPFHGKDALYMRERAEQALYDYIMLVEGNSLKRKQ